MSSEANVLTMSDDFRPFMHNGRRPVSSTSVRTYAMISEDIWTDVPFPAY